jgi:probable H4MPT-linked C1 transfer pathway protein
VQWVANGRAVRVWSTDGEFVGIQEARKHHLKVAAANWHALATFAGRYVPEGAAVLIDVGSTTTDVIPILDGIPVPTGKTDPERLKAWELIYLGVRRTPVACFFDTRELARELFATTLDALLLSGLVADNESDTDTADGRPATKRFAFDRMCRMFGGDRETIEESQVEELARHVVNSHLGQIGRAYMAAGWMLETPDLPVVIAAGSGEFFITSDESRDVRCWKESQIISLTAEFGPAVSACAPAYALAVLSSERQL